jgi:uncharacterized protein with HEPN domain
MLRKRSPIDYLYDILAVSEKAVAFTSGMDYYQFQKDEQIQFTVIRALEVIGEAAKRIPDDIRERHPAIAWREMSGMRDKMIHEYMRIDKEEVWKTVQEDIPGLLEGLKVVISTEEDSS